MEPAVLPENAISAARSETVTERRDAEAPVPPLRDRFAALRLRHPLPVPTGVAADKAFFDDLGGD